MGEIEKIREGLYVKKSFDGYRVVYPSKNEDGTLNWFNIITGGNYWKLIKTLLILLLIFAITWSYWHDVKSYREFQKNICDYLPNITNSCFKIQINNSLDNLIILNWSKENE